MVAADVLLLEDALEEDSQQAQVFTTVQPPYRIVSVNAAWTRLCGYQESEALGQTCKMLQGPSTSHEALEILHAGLRERRIVMVRLLNYTKFGSPFLNDLTVVPCCDVSGNITHFRGTLKGWEAGHPGVPRVFETPAESSSTSSIKEQLPNSIEEAKALVSISVVLTQSTPPFRIIYVNDEWCRLCGYARDEAIGRTCRMLQGPATCNVTLDALHRAAHEQSAITVRLLNYTRVRPLCSLLALPNKTRQLHWI